MFVTKGNIVKSVAHDTSAIVLAVTKDGNRAKVYVYGPDTEVWRPVTAFRIQVNGDEKCFKCMGSGLFYMGGAVVNGKYTGKTGPCFACQGKGVQTDADRVRCHYYWHRKADGSDIAELLPVGEPTVKPVANIAAARAKRRVKTVHGERSTTPATDAVEAQPRLIDCKCGFTHLDNIGCI